MFINSLQEMEKKKESFTFPSPLSSTPTPGCFLCQTGMNKLYGLHEFCDSLKGDSLQKV